MCGIYGYRARRVLFAVQLQDRGEHRARYVTAHETFENVVITLFDFEQGTDANYHDCYISYFYSAWIPYVEPRLGMGSVHGLSARLDSGPGFLRDKKTKVSCRPDGAAVGPRSERLHERVRRSLSFH